MINFKEPVSVFKNEIIETAQRLVQINTVESEALPNAPFGLGNRAALDYMLGLGEKWGFKTKDLNGYAGYLEFGEGEEVVLVIPHLDVVPVGEDWAFPPFGGEIHEGRIYGRGASDDKGPAVAALYAFKIVRDSGLPVGRRVRLAFGFDEESGFECVKHYIKTEGFPTLGFTPDGAFPVINAEKGVVGGTFVKRFSAETPALIFTGGSAPNIVPEHAKAIYEGKTYQATGIPSHASMPEAGKNAILLLAKKLQAAISHPVLDFLKASSDKVNLGIDLEDELSGSLSYNLALIDVDEKSAAVTVNIRYPVTEDGNKIIDRLKEAGRPFGFSFEPSIDSPPHYVPEDSFLVKTLMEAYTEVTGHKGKPQAMGGGTYARVLGNFVAYGGRLPEDVYNAHQKNEFITIDTLIKDTEIYAAAIYALASNKS